jgi:AbrB family looped-hinge helix DNA binding protein
MLMKTAKVTSKGQVTIPAEVRAALRLREGDTVTFEVEEGRAILKPQRDDRPFAKYLGVLREDQDLSAKQIVAELREERGW